MSAATPDTAAEGRANGARPRVLVKEKIGDSGVALLREHFDVEVGVDWDADELAQRIGDYEGIVIRSATKLTAELIDRAGNLQVIGRAGVGVDNVDVAAATKRGIVVANAPESNVVTAAEHTMALLLALARNIPQAYASLVAGKWDRSKFSGVELYEKTLGIIGFGRIGTVTARKASAIYGRTIAYDPYVSADLMAAHRVERRERLDALLSEADVIAIHALLNEETRHLIDRASLAA